MVKRLSDLIGFLLNWVFRNRIRQYYAWKNYEIGFTGKGPTALDVKPEFPKPWLPESIKKIIDLQAEDEANYRWSTFRDTIYDYTGDYIEE